MFVFFFYNMIQLLFIFSWWHFPSNEFLYMAILGIRQVPYLLSMLWGYIHPFVMVSHRGWIVSLAFWILCYHIWCTHIYIFLHTEISCASNVCLFPTAFVILYSGGRQDDDIKSSMCSAMIQILALHPPQYNLLFCNTQSCCESFSLSSRISLYVLLCILFPKWCCCIFFVGTFS